MASKHHFRSTFLKVSVPTEGTARRVARVTCRVCNAHDDWGAPDRLNPEAVAKYFTRRGWDVDHRNPARAKCPACAARPPASPPKPSPPPTLPLETKMSAGPVPVPAPVAVAAPETRDPTPDQKALIRRALDGSFDERKGHYLDNKSDQSIGKDLNVPWSWVQKLREAAYGPILEDPVLTGLRTDIAQMRTRITDLQETHRKQMLVLVHEVEKLQKRLDDHGAARPKVA